MTFTVVWRPQTPAFETPYVIAVVLLDEGVDMLTNLIDVEPAQVSIGDRVRVEFVDVEDLTLPFFTSAGAPGGAAAMSRRAVIVGAYNTRQARELAGEDSQSVTLDAVRGALADAGLDRG